MYGTKLHKLINEDIHISEQVLTTIQCSDLHYADGQVANVICLNNVKQSYTKEKS